MNILAGFLIFIVLAAASIILLNGWIWGAGYEPTGRKAKKELLAVLEKEFPSGRFVFYDLGSGFGSVLKTVKNRFPEATVKGVEIDPFKVGISRWRGCAVVRGNILKLDISKADIVYMFLSPLLLRKSEFREKLQAVPLIISYRHQIEGLDLLTVVQENLFVYARKVG